MRDEGLAGPGRSGRLPVNAPRLLRYGGLAFAGTLLALAVRFPLLDHHSVDFRFYLQAWYGFLVENDTFAALRYDFYDYNPSYLYLLAAAARLFPAWDLFAIKGISIGFELVQALLVGMCVRLRYPKSAALPILAGLAALFSPAVVVNGSWEAQCDVIHSAFLILCLHSLLRQRPAWAFAAFGLAFSVKPQAVFLLPLFLWVSQKKSIASWRWSLLAPLVYLTTLLPAWLLGRPFVDLLMPVVHRLDHERRLGRYAPNPYAWIQEDLWILWPLFAVLVIAGFAAVGIAIRRSRATLTPDLTVTLAALAAFAAPYLLPSMVERHFYGAAVLSIVLAFYRPSFAALPVLLGLASVGHEVGHSIFGWERISVVRVGAVVLLAPLVALLLRLARDLRYRTPLRAGWRWVAERIRVRRAEAPPLLILGACLAAVFTLGHTGGRFDRPAGDDPVSVRTLTRVENLSAEHSFVPYTSLGLTTTGEPVYEGVVGGAPASRLLLRAITLLYGEGDDREAQLRAARVTMAAFFGLAALLAYLALARLFRRRWVALGATLFAFSSFAGGGWDTVSADGAPALFALFLCFHGLVAFVRGGRLRNLLLGTGAALAFSLVAYWLVAPFVVVAIAESAWRRRSPSGASPGPRRQVIRWSQPALLAGFCLLFGAAVVGLGAAAEAELRSGGARLVEAATGGGGGYPFAR